MAKSAVAAVLDGYGGWHTVVAPRETMKHHEHPGMILLVVPDYEIDEPVPWDDIPTVVGTAERHIMEWIRTRNDPDHLTHPAVAQFLLRRLRTWHHDPDSDDPRFIVET